MKGMRQGKASRVCDMSTLGVSDDCGGVGGEEGFC